MIEKHNACQLCGFPTANRLDRQIGYRKSAAYYFPETFDELFGGDWNNSLELFCRKHVQVIVHESIYVRGFNGVYALGAISTKGNGYFYPAPSDDDINQFLVKYLIKLIKREKSGEPTIQCHAPDCCRWASVEREGVWLCRNHANNLSERNFYLRYGSEKQKSFERSKMGFALAENLLNQWKMEKENEI